MLFHLLVIIDIALDMARLHAIDLKVGVVLPTI